MKTPYKIRDIITQILQLSSLVYLNPEPKFGSD